MKTLLHSMLLTLPFIASAQPPAGGNHHGPPPPPEVLIVELFKKYDLDSDGKLSSEELAQGIEALIPPPPAGGGQPPAGEKPPGGQKPPGPAHAAAEMVRPGDSNGDQLLDRDELAAGLKAFHEANAGKHPRGPQPGQNGTSGPR